MTDTGNCAAGYFCHPSVDPGTRTARRQGAAAGGAMDGGGEARGVPERPGRDGMAQADELAALRARLREVEAALDLPARPGRPTPPSLGAVLARVAALERRAGIVPGLLPLPGCDSVAAATPPTPPRPRWQAWLDRGQVLLAAALVAALGAWLLRPLPARVPPVPPTAPPAAPASVRATPYRVSTEEGAVAGNPGRVSVGPGYQFTYHDDDAWLYATPGPVIDFGPSAPATTPVPGEPADRVEQGAR